MAVSNVRGRKTRATHGLFWPITSLMLVWLAAQPAAAGVLGVGTIGLHPSEEVSRLAPLADYLVRQLWSPDMSRSRVMLADNVFAIADWVERGEVDVYVGELLPALAVSEIANLSVQFQCGSADTRTVVIANKKAGIERVDHLAGKVVAFESPTSTFGYLWPKFLLLRKGARLRRCDAASAALPGNTVGYVFSGDDENTVEWVARGKSVAGAVASHRYDSLGGAWTSTLREIHRSDPLPKVVIGLRPTLPSATTQKLSEVLRGLDADPAGAEALRNAGVAGPCRPFVSDAVPALAGLREFLRAEFGLE